jgi:hypothetical protein
MILHLIGILNTLFLIEEAATYSGAMKILSEAPNNKDAYRMSRLLDQFKL